MENLGSWPNRRANKESRKDKNHTGQNKQNIKQQESQQNWKLPGVQNQPAELQSTTKGKDIYKLPLMILKRLCWKRMMHYTAMLSMTI